MSPIKDSRNRDFPEGDALFRAFLEPDEETPDSYAVKLVDRLLDSMAEKDRRRHLLYQLRRQLIDDETTLREARQAILELEAAIEKLSSPANRVATFLGSPKEGLAYVSLGGSDYYANIDTRLDPDELKIGTRVLLNEAYVVVGDLGYAPNGAVLRVSDVLPDERLRIGQEPGNQSIILQRSSDLLEQPIKSGDEIRVDPNTRVALERLEGKEAQDYFLEELPEVDWSQIGGQDDAIQAIKDAIEMPLLHPELFTRFEYDQPKGFLLYGPPGCGKTLIGKATAYNLTQQLRSEIGDDTRGYFLHIKGPEILNMWLGESERKVREIFSIAREKRREGHLPFIFIDEAESVLGTRRALRSHNISNTVVPMFCSEMDGIESLQDVVIILATNRPDLIDPAILRPGRIDRKIKVRRPGLEGAREIFGIYLTPSLPITPNILEEHGGDSQAAIQAMVEQANDALFSRNEAFLEVHLRSGRREKLYRGDLCSGAIIASIVQRAKETAIKRAIAGEGEDGISLDDLINGIDAEYDENDIFPPSDNTEDWLKLIDYEPENVVRVVPVRPEKQARRKSPMKII